jgi:hypothetical protein
MVLTWREPVDLGSVARPAGAVGTRCQDSVVDGDCGLGEPQVEVDSAGTIYVSGVCCLTVPPPVYVSRDGGRTFTDLATDTGVREQFGIEGDFAIDDLGRIYFADIEFAATFQVTAWEADGTFLHHTKWPALPIVDRDWIRAEGDGTLYYVYNAPPSTHIYKSSDTGRTWSPTPIHSSSFGLGMAVKGLAPGELWILGGSDGGMTTADYTLDGGLTWQVETTSAPDGASFPVGAFSEDGSLFAAGNSEGHIQVARRTPQGEWLEAVQVSPDGTHQKPWMGTGAGNMSAAICWYGTADEQVSASSEWRVHVATTTAGGANGTWNVTIPDQTTVFAGQLSDQLLDFFQCEVGPDGAVHVAYSRLFGEGTEEQLTYVRSEPSALAAAQYPWGPK